MGDVGAGRYVGSLVAVVVGEGGEMWVARGGGHCRAPQAGGDKGEQVNGGGAGHCFPSSSK